MTSPPLIDALEVYMAATSDPWAPGYTDRKAAATTALRDAVEGLARGAGHPDALRVWGALEAERQYAERNAAAGDRMHRTTPDYGPVVHAAHARCTADRDGIPAAADAAWCPVCRTRRAVEDVDSHATYHKGSHEVEVTATHLACGHTTHSPERIVGPAPGGGAAAEATAQEAIRRRLERTSAANDGQGY